MCGVGEGSGQVVEGLLGRIAPGGPGKGVPECLYTPSPGCVCASLLKSAKPLYVPLF